MHEYDKLHRKKNPQTSDIKRTLAGNKIVDHSDIVGTSLSALL